MNHFSTFGLQPRPWLDQETLKTQYLALSTRFHPDKAASPGEKSDFETRSSALNESYNLLRNSRRRLLHLLELCGVPKAPHVQAVPPGVMDLFPTVAEITSKTEDLLREKRQATSPMLQIQLFQRALNWTDKIQEVQAVIQQRMASIESEVRSLDSGWDEQAGKNPDSLKTLEKAAATLGFLERWNAQLQERSATLTFT